MTVTCIVRSLTQLTDCAAGLAGMGDILQTKEEKIFRISIAFFFFFFLFFFPFRTDWVSLASALWHFVCGCPTVVTNHFVCGRPTVVTNYFLPTDCIRVITLESKLTPDGLSLLPVPQVAQGVVIGRHF